MTFKNRKNSILIGAIIIVLSLAISAVSSTGVTYAQSSTMPTTSKEAIYSSMEGKLPGFSGMFVDENGRLNVYVTDPNKVATVDKTTFGNLVDTHHLEKGIVIQKGKQPWHQWSEWMQTAIQLTENKDLNIVAIGIDDKNQMLVIGFEELNKTRSDTVTKFLTQHQIPLDMVSIVATGKAIPTDGATVHPLEGGAQLGVVGATYTPPYCTIGFIANSLTYGSVATTAGHCEASYPNHNQQYTQPSGGSVVGSETANTNKPPPRYADILLFTPSISTNLGKIYQGGIHQTIESKAYSQFVGDSVCSYGATSNYRCGAITQTGWYTYDSGIGGYLYGQVIASFPSQKGDSGGPVYQNDLVTGKVILYGTVWEQLGVDHSTFSPIGGIEFDEGTLQVN